MIEVGAVRFRGDEVLEEFQSLVRPEVPIPRAVQELTGIRDADVEAAPHPEQVLEELINFVGGSSVSGTAIRTAPSPMPTPLASCFCICASMVVAFPPSWCARCSTSSPSGA